MRRAGTAMIRLLAMLAPLALLLVALGPLAVLPATLAAQAGTDLAGTWQGAAETPAGLLGMSLELERVDGAWEGTFAIPAEMVEVPLAEVRVDGDSVTIRLAPSREIRAMLADDSIGGVLDIEGRSMPVAFGRAGSATARRIEDALGRDAERADHPPLEETATGEGRTAVDAAALDRLVEAADAAHSHALVVLRDGELVGAWHAGGERRRIELMSATKSILNLAVGRLLAVGALDSIDEPVHTFYPEWAEGDRSRITIRHLLNHTSGLESPMPTHPIYASDDFVRFALDAELVEEPGTEIRYNNNAANLLAGIVGRAARERLDRFLGRQLFEPLGITDFRWSLDPAGNPHGMAGLQMHAEDVARLGQLVLQRGEWEGERLIEEAWFDESLAPGSGLSEDVGLLWWLIREDDRIIGYRADGYLGQYLVIYPEQGLVGVRLVASTPAYSPETDGFGEFQSLVRDLVP